MIGKIYQAPSFASAPAPVIGLKQSQTKNVVDDEINECETQFE